MLGDHEWAAGVLQRNQRALEGSYDALARELHGWAWRRVCLTSTQLAGSGWAAAHACSWLGPQGLFDTVLPLWAACRNEVEVRHHAGNTHTKMSI